MSVAVHLQAYVSLSLLAIKLINREALIPAMGSLVLDRSTGKPCARGYNLHGLHCSLQEPKNYT